MNRTPNHHDDDDDGTDTSSHREGKSAERKPSSHRSKHSETEQRRRNKINERFQLLKELIPPNDQKRDKASLLLEVIEYIQFLQEKLQVYEGSYQQVCTQEPTNFLPWRGSHGPADSFGNHSQVVKNGSLDEDSITEHLTSTHGSLESEFSREFAYRGADLLAEPSIPAIPFGVPFQAGGFAPGRSVLQTENHVSHPHFSSIECSVLGNEDNAYESSSSSISNVYSQGVLRKLTQALQTSGVDLSQANISVQLDVGKRENSGSMALASTGSQCRP
ncbi:hypothetical protein RND81_10G116100 [Saponaria officinalis]|uniref:BHLH domain-containing protein n=1 Tax=Saponaria officinalis TaxID=3572 RepID=A0AAW1I3F1_SAPOF